MDKLTLLSEINLFNELPLEDLQIIDRMSTMAPVPKGTILLSPYQQISSLFFLKEGQVRLYQLSEEGKELTVDVLVKGNMFGETSSFSLTAGAGNMYVETMTDSKICTMRKQEFEYFMEQNPKIALKFIRMLSNRLTENYSLTEKIALHDVRYRLVYLLLRLSEKTGTTEQEQWQSIDMKVTHADIAHMIGSTRETVSMIFSKLVKEQLLLKEKSVLYIHRERALAELESLGN
ncbi:Crp/Fnr family transcriptional regulator [Sinobaca sp. H24]|uniref:Crp/Fnr family transcriptional regulator n=1 Tax=Sinobaca sp. H24 TaxID=2923376 RepID=UPI00207AAC2C|nr:Crp/Fnr family transcriptional regulator [Sinobaca sp. H24]